MNADKEFLVKGSIINGIGLLTRVVSPFLVILLARYYPQKEFGLFISFQAMAITLSRIAILGLDKGLLWYVPRVDGKEGNAGFGLASSLMVSAAISAALFAIFALMGLFGFLGRFETLRDMSLPFMLLMVASIWPFTAIHLFSSALEGLRLPQYRVLIALFLTTSLVPLLAFLLRRPLGDEMSLGAGMFLGNLVGFLLFLPIAYRRFPGEPWWRASRPPRALMHYSLPLAGSELIVNVLGRVEIWMILLLLGPEKVAVYAVMVTITNGLRTVRQTFDPLLIPIISRLKPEELATDLRSSFSYATNMVSTIQIAIACVILVFPREILSVAGRDYAVEVFAFALLLMGNLANGFLGLNGLVMLGIGKSRHMLALTASALVLTLVCNWFFIPRLGIVGAALSAFLVIVYQNVIQYLYVRLVRRLDLYEPHLYLNAVLEVIFLSGFFLVYHRIEALSLPARAGLFSLMILSLGALLFLKRKTFILK